MKDTSEMVVKHFQNMIMKRSPIERLLMGCSMFDTAKQIVQTAIMNQHPKICPNEMKKEIFLRFYGTEFNEHQIKKILKIL